MLNSVNLQGRICRDLKLENVDYQGKTFQTLAFELAVQTGKKDKDNKNECYFIRCQVSGLPAQNLAKYQQKGSQIIVNGSLVRQSWKKDNNFCEKYFVKVSNVYFCDPKKTDETKTVETAKSAKTTVSTPTNDSLPF